MVLLTKKPHGSGLVWPDSGGPGGPGGLGVPDGPGGLGGPGGPDGADGADGRARVVVQWARSTILAKENPSIVSVCSFRRKPAGTDQTLHGESMVPQLIYKFSTTRGNI